MNPRPNKPPIWELPLSFIDVETTGTDERQHEIVEIAVLNERGNVVLNEKILAERLETATEEALEINGYDEKRWRQEGAKLWADVAPRVLGALAGTLVVGWRTEFDLRFIRQGMERVGGDTTALPYRIIDVQSLAWEHLGRTRIQAGLSLARTCDTLGIPHRAAHTARGDAGVTREAYFQLVGAGFLRRLGWRLGAALRELSRGRD